MPEESVTRRVEAPVGARRPPGDLIPRSRVMVIAELFKRMTNIVTNDERPCAQPSPEVKTAGLVDEVH